MNNIDNFVVKEFKEKSDQQNTSKRRLPLNDFVIRAKENEVRIFMFTCCACVHILLFWLVQQCTEECLCLRIAPKLKLLQLVSVCV